MLSLSLAHFAKEVEKKKSETKLNELKKSDEEIDIVRYIVKDWKEKAVKE